MSWDDLDRTAAAEILAESKRAAARAAEWGVSGWRKSAALPVNKRFLTNTVISTLLSRRALLGDRALVVNREGTTRDVPNAPLARLSRNHHSAESSSASIGHFSDAASSLSGRKRVFGTARFSTDQSSADVTNTKLIKTSDSSADVTSAKLIKTSDSSADVTSAKLIKTSDSSGDVISTKLIKTSGSSADVTSTKPIKTADGSNVGVSSTKPSIHFEQNEPCNTLEVKVEHCDAVEVEADYVVDVDPETSKRSTFEEGTEVTSLTDTVTASVANSVKQKKDVADHITSNNRQDNIYNAMMKKRKLNKSASTTKR